MPIVNYSLPRPCAALRGRVCPPRFLTSRPGEDDLLLGYGLAMSHPNYAARALNDPRAIDGMRSKYLNELRNEPRDSLMGFELPESWWTAGHLE